jgi:glutamate synthase domain-containing protein 3
MGLLRRWEDELQRFVKVMPHDYKRALAEPAGEEATPAGAGR